MADKIKEFINTTYHLTDVVANKLPIITTNATTQAVVKDISITTSKNLPGSISLNGYTVSDSIESLNGSEIIDINSSLNININVPVGIVIDRTALTFVGANIYTINSTTSISYTLNAITSGSASATTITGTTLSEQDILATYSSVMTTNSFPTIINPTTTTTTTTTTVGSMSSPNWVYKDITSGNMYYCAYNGNDATYLYYSTNNGGSWTALDSVPYAYKCINPAGKITWVSGTTFNYVNHGTTTITGTVALSGRITGDYATSSYTHASECNGWHFWIPSYSYLTILYGYNHAKNIAVTITIGTSMQDNSGGGICVTYNSTTGKYYVFNWDSATRYLHRIDTNIDALVADGTGTGTNLSTTVNINNVASYTTGGQWFPTTNKMIFVDNITRKIMSTEFNDTSPYYTTPIIESDVTSVGGVITLTTTSYSAAAQHIDVYASYLDTTATIQVRATGIETTL